MLEHSTRLLKVRARAASIATASEIGEDEDDDEDEEGSGEGSLGDGSGEGEEGDEDNMSSSGSEEDEVGDGDDDANLTVEQLRAKYSKVTEDTTENVISNPILSPMHMSDEDTHDDAEAEENSVLADDESARFELEKVDDILLDDDDDSVEMDSEFDSAGSGFGSDSDDEGDETQHPGLLGFFEDMENLVKKGSKQGDVTDGSNRIKELLEADDVDVKEEEEEYKTDKGVNGIAAVEATSKQVLPATDGVPATEDSALIVHTPTQDDGRMEIDDDTTASNSPAQNKLSGSTTSHTTPQPNLDIKTPVPFLLRGTLREYQHYGLDWLAGLYSNKTNGILADEMGLGKTIQTIALIAHLACEKGIWGPHLIVVPTSVMLNWEMEFKKWAPGFKILTYYGSREQRAEKRKGWYDDNLWHVCITSYQLVLQDQVTFKRRNWHYLILDEAHNIKNFRSQRWQTLLNFKAEARLLITGTPLQNNLIELWSLLYFLMPSGASSSMPTGFANLKEFQEWFAHPVDQLIEGGRDQMDDEARNTVTKLHRVLRPYLLRRLKADVEKQMPAKYEHIVYCRLSKRQRYLYDDFMSLSKTRETLASGNYLSIINCLMQLRKVCNHPDLFETRQIVTSFAMSRSVVADFEIKELLVRRKMLNEGPFEKLDLGFLNLLPGCEDSTISRYTARNHHALNDSKSLKRYIGEEAGKIDISLRPEYHSISGYQKFRDNVAKMSLLERLKHCVYINEFRCNKKPIYGKDLLEICKTNVGPLRTRPIPRSQTTETFLKTSTIIRSMILTVEERADQMATLVDKFGCVTPTVVCTDLPPLALSPLGVQVVEKSRVDCPSDPFHRARMRLSIAFPDKRLLQYDCGKLQRLDLLLRELQAGGHRALIFTQMTKVLDILEQFLNIHGHRYLRLDGSTKVEQRQILTERFNNDQRILVFILSTRSGGLGINLTGADTVIFYDLDWNPAMDKQCQDRCHRIGQTRDVHIYRFVSEYTIESNILRKSEQKRMLDDVVIQEGEFTTDYFERLTLKEMLGDDVLGKLSNTAPGSGSSVLDQEDLLVAQIPKGGKREMEKALELAEDLEDVVAAKAAQRELVDVDGADFGDVARSGITPTTVASTPTNTATATPPTTVRPPSSVNDNTHDRNEEEEDAAAAQEEEEEDAGHVDDWMIKYMDWEVDTLPVLPASKDSRKRRRERSKKGKMYK
ncbi:SNF2 family N-terminal domain-containing protein [Peziza echinospora]|nr:SNF2 family N-terminal domain-containing protein [Peziza echinospora]